AVIRLLGVLVGPDRLAIEHDKAPARESATLCNDDAVGAFSRYAELRGDRVGRVLDARSRALRNAQRALPIDEMIASPRQARPLEDGLDRRLGAGVQRQRVVASRLRA